MSVWPENISFSEAAFFTDVICCDLRYRNSESLHFLCEISVHLKLNIAQLRSRYIHEVSVKVGKELVEWFFDDHRLVL